jgi:hypothetical protein
MEDKLAASEVDCREVPGSDSITIDEIPTRQERQHRAKLGDGSDPTTPKLRFSPPIRAFVNRKDKLGVRFCCFSWTLRDERPICARVTLKPDERRGKFHIWKGVKLEMNRGQTTALSAWPMGLNNCLCSIEREKHESVAIQLPQQRQYPLSYLVVGVMDRKTGVPIEVAVDKIAQNGLFNAIHSAVRKLRPWWKRIFSLKSVGSFSMYECLPAHAYHLPVELDQQAELTLAELYHDFNRGRVDDNNRWLGWIQEHFNPGDTDAEKRCYALQLVLRWSIRKIVVYGLTPLMFSLAIGFWYQTTPGDDRHEVIQTAWSISSYILAWASIAFAVLAAVTQIGDV